MLNRTLIIGAAMLVAALPAAAQDRGTIELGGFLSYNIFDKAYQMDNAIGFGGLVGAYLDPRWSLEFDANGGNATRPSGLSDRSFVTLNARVAYVPIKFGRGSIVLGGGVSHVDANVSQDFTDQNFGYHALVGGKIALTETAAMRLDYVLHFNDDAQHSSLRAGVSLYRRPEGKTSTVYRTAEAPYRADSVSAAETRRLRALEARYAALRDSLARNPVTAMTPSNVAALATMLEMVHFEHDKSDLDAVARAILDDKVVIFNANPDMKIVITGYTSMPGTAQYNMDLGMRRAVASKAYLVSRGVNPNRIEIATRGQNNLLVEGPGEVADAANRRGQFRLLIADPYLVTPRP
ncbi:MAG: OmpA family protein [Gemmatimonadaceae bacterium]